MTDPQPHAQRQPHRGQFPRILLPLLALADPTLSGAACAGRAPLFDDEIVGETAERREARHRIATSICGRCPVQPQCRAAAGDHHALGIWAGACQPRSVQPAATRTWRPNSRGIRMARTRPTDEKSSTR
ncbi:MAG: WhiB family transcriptional regulator [Rhodococcus sp. (in: high G+C Gram-positive bacteria)]|uniref:WhiB family transcriptional regulator n=1 Tax=Rhodococcus sp. TaxID=1831 RepID=UPI002AD60E85|nr:WhiB family transcriptional regulator [Rhodococcus sp. (in: high G+C Gram-positive bacteria)]